MTGNNCKNNNTFKKKCTTKPTTNEISLDDAIDVCNDFLVSIKGTLTDEDLIILDMKPMYKPTSNISNYYEFKVGTEENNNNGYVIVGMTLDEYPITEFSLEGDSYYNEFKKRTGIENIKVLRFGADFYTCEDINGKFLDSMGIIPSYGINNNESAFIESTPSGINESPNLKRIISHIPCSNYTNKEFNYTDFKKSFVEYKKSKTEKELIDKIWNFTRSTQIINNKSMLYKSETSSQVSSAIKKNDRIEIGEFYDRYTANGSENQSYFTQLDSGESTNTTDHSSGCGATAWMNLLGWHDLNFTPELLREVNTENNPYTDELTMKLHDYLDTTGIGYVASFLIGIIGQTSTQGITWPWNIKNGIDFVREQLKFIVNGYWVRSRTGINPAEWFGYQDGYWIFEVVKAYIENKKLPVIVGYFQDWHYCIAYETIKQNLGIIQMPWIHLNRGWGSSGYVKNNAWITPSGLFACIGVDEFTPLLSLSHLLEQPEFEVHLSRNFPPMPIEEITTRTIKTNKMIVYNGIAVLNSLGCFNQGIFITTISFLVGKNFLTDENIEVIAKASLASISNDGHSVNCLYEVDSVQAYRDSVTGKIRVNVRVALRDTVEVFGIGDIELGANAYLHRISYQVIVLTK